MKSSEIKAVKHSDSDIVKILSGGGCTMGNREELYSHRR